MKYVHVGRRKYLLIVSFCFLFRFSVYFLSLGKFCMKNGASSVRERAFLCSKSELLNISNSCTKLFHYVGKVLSVADASLCSVCEKLLFLVSDKVRAVLLWDFKVYIVLM